MRTYERERDKSHSRFNTVFSFENRYIKIMQLTCVWICIGGNKNFFCSHFFFATIIHEIIKQQQQLHILHCFNACRVSCITHHVCYPWYDNINYAIPHCPLIQKHRKISVYVCVMHQYRELWCKRRLLLVGMQNNPMTCAARRAKIRRRGSEEK